MNSSIEELEIAHAASSGDVGILQDLVTELKHRKSKRAATLLAKVATTLSGSIPTKAEPPKIEPKPFKPDSPASEKPRAVHGTHLPTGSAPTRPQAPQPTPPTGDGDQPPLPLHLQEFVQALHEEIDAAKKNIGSNAALLSEGRLIAPVGGGFHYRFQSQRPLRVPPDTPGFLAIPSNDADIQVSVVEIEDLSVVLELPKHIGATVPQAKLKTDLTMLLLRLIDRIETKGLNSYPPADRVLGFTPATLAIQGFDAFNTDLNAEQRLAVGSVLGGDTVFIWGPPGTGKTQTIGEIGAQLFTRRKTMLIVSHTNAAVDEALLRIAVAL
ncbi:MAG: AAA domain-containing protein, partial [Prosthecobacter sp.]|nr:AAA domain-containing protein [Prosthecobacter sp.]